DPAPDDSAEGARARAFTAARGRDRAHGARAARSRFRLGRRRDSAAAVSRDQGPGRRGRGAVAAARARSTAESPSCARDCRGRMERGPISGGHDSSDGGVPTPRARRARLATGSAALLAADAVAVSVVLRAGRPALLALLAAAVGVAFVVAALLVVWDNGLVAGPAMLLVAYALSLADNGRGLDWTAPLIGAGLVVVVELGSGSRERRGGAEEHTLMSGES